MRLVWTFPARGDLRDAFVHIHAENPKAARNVIGRLRHHAARLIDFPNLGKPGRVAETRELVVPKLPYIVVYSVTEEEITVLRVWHAKQSRKR